MRKYAAAQIVKQLYPDVKPYIAECSVYVLTSYREGTPRTVLEAMSMGRAVITTDALGCRETVVDGDNGFLVPVKDGKLFEMIKFRTMKAITPCLMRCALFHLVIIGASGLGKDVAWLAKHLGRTIKGF